MDDCAEQLVRLALKPQLGHFAYNNGGETVTADELAALVRRWLPDAQIAFDETKPTTPLIDRRSGARLEEEIGFKPRPLVEGVRAHINEARARRASSRYDQRIMTRFRNTVVGSYPRPASRGHAEETDAQRRPRSTSSSAGPPKTRRDLGLDVVTDGEGYRENMYYFYQKRLDGVSMENMPKKTFGYAGFGIECAAGRRRNQKPALQSRANWKTGARRRTEACPREADRHRPARADAVQRQRASGSLSRRTGAVPRLGGGARRRIARGDRRGLRLHPVRRADVDRSAGAERMGGGYSERADRFAAEGAASACTSAAAIRGASGFTSRNTPTSCPPSAR